MLLLLLFLWQISSFVLTFALILQTQSYLTFWNINTWYIHVFIMPLQDVNVTLYVYSYGDNMLCYMCQRRVGGLYCD